MMVHSDNSDNSDNIVLKPSLKGRGSHIQPDNPYHDTHLSAESTEAPCLEEEGTLRTQIYYETSRSIVNRVKSPDVPMMYSVNPYQGCEHGCSYCYARPTHEYWGFTAGLDFETKIVVKREAPRLLRKQLGSKHWVPAPIGLSGNTDCYQPLERRFRLTRQLLEVCLLFGNPVAIITKNSLVQRDMDVLEALAAKDLVRVYMSLTTTDESLRRRMEPRTASVEKRLQTIERLSGRGIPVGVMTAPIIPGLNDHEIPALLKLSAERGARAASYTVVRLDKNVAPVFKEWLARNVPERQEKVWAQIAAMHDGQVGDAVYGRRMRGEGHLAQMIQRLFKLAHRKYFATQSMPAFNLRHFKREATASLFD